MTPNNAVTASNMTTDPDAQRRDLTARGDAQSKRFRRARIFARAMMILSNTGVPTMSGDGLVAAKLRRDEGYKTSAAGRAA